jgi:hypothetical protein
MYNVEGICVWILSGASSDQREFACDECFDGSICFITQAEEWFTAPAGKDKLIWGWFSTLDYPLECVVRARSNGNPRILTFASLGVVV